ncbi:hypothetical protein F4604DRAFT_855103 [Suillus subluteus]|nr:hypothetical protein F4604DRAFT_855103 [Suillus subluteus]
MLLSSYLLIPTLFCRVPFALIAMQMEMQEIWAHKPRKMKILITLALSRIADFCLTLSWACLASCGLGLLLEVNSVNYWMFLAGACTFAPFLDAVFKRNVRAMIWRGGLALILWFGVTLGYLQQIWELDC